MEQKELTKYDISYGDYVCYNEIPVMVISITNGNGYMFDVVEIDGKWHETNHLTPLLITPERLKNNGFYEDKYGAFILDGYESENSPIVLVGVNSIDRLIINTQNDTVDIKCHYMHELQHVLRLCKINKHFDF